MEKKYSINVENDVVVSVEVNGIQYDSPDEIPDPDDRAQVLRLMAMSGDDTFDSDFDEAFDQDFRELERVSARFPTIIIAVFLIVAAVMLSIAVISAVITINTLAKETSAPGHVVDLVARQSWDSDTQSNQTYYYPVVEFDLPDGTRQTIQLAQGNWPPAYSEGEAVTIRYDPAKPTNARIHSPTGTIVLWLLPGITGVVGLVFLGVTVFAYQFLKPDLTETPRI